MRTDHLGQTNTANHKVKTSLWETGLIYTISYRASQEPLISEIEEAASVLEINNFKLKDMKQA